MKLTPESRVGDILAAHPETEAVFTELGFTELQNPVMRKTVAKFATLKIASSRKNVDLDLLIQRLETAIE
ncbi:MAG: DUF1858 domain-containing protein [Firmicutes bacterium]|nr:DUF1858 domain-containing protein [Bacillota bacterium]